MPTVHSTARAPRIPRATWGALAACLLPVTAAAARSPLEPRVRGKESYAETYTAMADLEDGTYVQVQLMISNVGWGDQHGICRALVVLPDGRFWTRAAKHSRKQWRFDAAPEPTLSVGACRMTGGEALTVEARLGGGSVSLRIDAPPSPVAPGQALRVDSGSYAADVLVPRAAVSAVVAVPGRPESRLSGFGYSDHSRSTAKPRDLARRWVRFRGLDGSCSTLLLAREPRDRAAADGWVWLTAEGEPEALEGVRLGIPPTPSHGTDVVVHTSRGVYTFETQVRLFRHAPMEEHGTLGKIAGSMVGNPVTLTYRAVLRAPGGCAPIPGILEITEISG